MQNQYLQCKHKKLGTFLARTGFGTALFVKRALNRLKFPSLLVTFRTSLLLTPAYRSATAIATETFKDWNFEIPSNKLFNTFIFFFFHGMYIPAIADVNNNNRQN